MAWFDRGSIASNDWLPWAILAALLLATVATAGGLVRLDRIGIAAVASLAGLAAWAALSLTWAPLPAVARDEALLVTLYALCLLVPPLTLRGDAERAIAVGALALAGAALALLVAAKLLVDPDPELFFGGRLAFPISYANAQAAVFLVAFWPALAIAASRRAASLLRGAALAAATASIGGWLLCQSKGGGIALAISLAIVLGISGQRLRLLLPLGLVAVVVAAAFVPLTEPYRAETTAATAAAIRDAGAALLLCTAATFALGVAYAAGDRRLDLSPRARRLAARAVGTSGITIAVAVTALAFVRTDPVATADRAWAAFKQSEESDGSTHFVSLGSHRYDFWRVALQEAQSRPLVGHGARSFGPIYLRERESDETPVRTHSLPLETLLETGLVGLLLLTVAIGLPLLRAAQSAATLAGVASLGGASYWLVHASGDWIWTVPAAGMPFFLLLGIALSGERPRLERRAELALAVAAAILSVALFAPPLVSARLSRAALSSGDGARLGLAQRLDPLSTEPFLVRAALAEAPEEAVPPLQEAVASTPADAALRELLAQALLEAGRPASALAQLRRAHALDPRDPRIRAAIARASR